MSNIKECKYCKNKFDLEGKVKGWLANHTRWCHKNPKFEEYRNIIRNAKMDYSKISIGIKKAWSEGKYKNKDKDKNKKRIPHTEETKKLLSKLRKEYLKNNPDKHPWKNHNKFRSAPCEVFKERLRSEGIEFLEEISFGERNYSVDIFIPDRKLVIEINGNQHYNSDKTLKEYYQKRHEYLLSLGLKVMEMHYTLVYKEISNSIIENIVSIESKLENSYLFDFLISKKLKNTEEDIRRKEIRNGIKLARIAKKDCMRKEILSSNIDFSKFGWVNGVAKILGIRYQKVNNWMKKNMLGFYELNCYKRK